MNNKHLGLLLVLLVWLVGLPSAWAGRTTAGGCGAFDSVGWRLASTGLSIPDNAVVGQSLGVIATADVVVSNSTYACNTANDTGVFNIGLVGAFTNQWPVTGADGLWSTSTPFIKFRVTGNGALIRSFAGNAASPLGVNISSGQIPPVYSFSVPQGVIRFSVEAVVGAIGKPPAGTQISTAYLPEASYLLGMLDAADVLTYNDVVQVVGTVDGSTSIPILSQPTPSAPSLWLGKNLFSALQVGVSVQYQIDVMNDGPGASGATVDLYDQLPPNMAYVSASNAACAVIGGPGQGPEEHRGHRFIGGQCRAQPRRLLCGQCQPQRLCHHRPRHGACGPNTPDTGPPLHFSVHGARGHLPDQCVFDRGRWWRWGPRRPDPWRGRRRWRQSHRADQCDAGPGLFGCGGGGRWGWRFVQ